MKLLRLISVLGALLVLALPAQAWSRGLPLRLKAPHKVTAASSSMTAAVRTSQGARCSLHARGGRSGLRLPPARANRRGRVTWSWLVPAKAPTGRWRVSVTCDKGRRHRAVSRSVIVSTRGHNRYGPLLQRSTARILVGGPAKTLKRAPRLAAHAASAASDPFPAGQCTWWAAKKRPDLYPKVHGNAGDWLAEAQAGGIPTGSTPAVGAIAVFLPYVAGAGGYGHVAYVESVNGDGTITISEYNWSIPLGGPDYRRIPASNVSGFIYGGPVKTPGYAPAPPTAPAGYHVYGTGSEGLIEHRSPDASSSKTGVLANGAAVNVACQTQSSSVVNGSAIWDKLANGNYVSDYFVDTPDVGAFTPSITRCSVPPPPPTTTPPPGSGQYQIANAPGGVFLRNGPTTGSAVAGTLPDAAPITIVCQTKSGSYVSTSDVWDLLSNNAWVSDYYTTTPVVGNFSPGLAQCGSSSAPTYVAPAGSTPQTYHVQRVGSAGLYERSGPGTNYSQIGWLANGATIMIACQIKSDSAVNGSAVWDLLTDGKFITDYYTDTPVVGDYSPGIGHCTAQPAL